MGSRHADLIKSFKLAIRSLLTSSSKEDFLKAFSTFSSVDQTVLHRLFLQVITSLHKMIEDEFESLCLETQVGITLDTVEELVEEQSLDPLFSETTNVKDIAQNLSVAKKCEINQLMSMLEKAEEQNRLIKVRVEQLKKGRQDVSCTPDAEKILLLRSGISNYGASCDGI